MAPYLTHQSRPHAHRAPGPWRVSDGDPPRRPATKEEDVRYLIEDRPPVGELDRNLPQPLRRILTDRTRLEAACTVFREATRRYVAHEAPMRPTTARCDEQFVVGTGGRSNERAPVAALHARAGAANADRRGGSSRCSAGEQCSGREHDDGKRV